MDEGIIQKLVDGYELDLLFFFYHVHVRAYFLFWCNKKADSHILYFITTS